MKISKPKKEIRKFDLEKMEVAKLKNIHLVKGGDESNNCPIDTKSPQKGSSGGCQQNY
jgi:hypothetical protein